MGRVKYSPEARKKIVASFVEATAHIIENEGLDAVSIRKVASQAGYSSATMYLYFRDLDELITMSSISYLRDYLSELAADAETMQTAEAEYLHTWELFCKYSFANAPIFLHLYFKDHNDSLGDIIKEYYSVFPNELDKISGAVLSMLLSGDLYERTIKVLEPYAAELGFSADEAALINEITIGYYRTLLESFLSREATPENIESTTERFISATRFILENGRHSEEEA
ncbi:TetR/AcrR family transcriptional regulator [Adlercreutzia sp. ZJ138]|uniref:TetR/AcrR family transcriptional regulator n=1 Tax=Adlercreutzia sp. ZJ138 TaxID=2709405 RepID=UPI0013EC4B4F|nr:TetR family transcriptional regulator [Adlercreutzia sp. ZJ138]